MKNPQETKIVNLALNNLEAVNGIHGEWEFLEHTENTGVDGILTITLGETRIKFNADIKKEVRHTQLERIIGRHTMNVS